MQLGIHTDIYEEKPRNNSKIDQSKLEPQLNPNQINFYKKPSGSVMIKRMQLQNKDQKNVD